jgi:hypothetical protein
MNRFRVITGVLQSPDPFRKNRGKGSDSPRLRQGRAREWALQKLMTIGEACRAMLRESLRATLTWAIAEVTEKERPLDDVMAHLRIS